MPQWMLVKNKLKLILKFKSKFIFQNKILPNNGKISWEKSEISPSPYFNVEFISEHASTLK